MATKIRCKYLDCAFLDEGYCISAQIDLDSDKGCLTYQSNDELPLDENIDEIDNINEWEDVEEERVHPLDSEPHRNQPLIPLSDSGFGI